MKAHALWLFPLLAFLGGWALHPSQNPSAPSAAPADPKAKPEASTPSPASSSSPATVTVSEPPPVFFPAHLTAKEALNFPGELHRLAAFAEFLKTASVGDLAALYRDWLAAQGNSMAKDDYYQLLFERWVELDAEGAVHTVIGLGGHWIYSVMFTWADRDPQAALAWLDHHASESAVTSGSELREKVLEVVRQAKPEAVSPGEALRRIRELSKGDAGNPTHITATTAVFADWAKQDADAAWQAALHSADVPDGARKYVVGTLVRVLAPSDPTRIQQLIASLPAGELRDAAAADFTGILGTQNFPAARDFALSLPEGQARIEALKNLGRQQLQKSSADLASYLAALPAKDTEDLAPFRDTFEAWLGTDPAGAGAYLKAHLPPDLQPTAQQSDAYYWMFSSWSGRDPRASADFLLQLPPSIGTKPLNYAVARMARANPAEAAQWVAASPEGPSRDALFGTVATEWAQHDLKGVTTWLNGLPPSSGKSAAVETLAQQVMSTNPDDALAWVRTIPEPARREQALNRVWNAWIDRDAASRWRDASPNLTPAERAALGGK